MGPSWPVAALLPLSCIVRLARRGPAACVVLLMDFNYTIVYVLHFKAHGHQPPL